jgi:benzoyl-CoA reductase/2-hydroxyglutaryl-CoA dehydratase subunit BcrC/BadD/HgdB
MTKLKTQEKLKEYLSGYYGGLGKHECPVAWCTSVGPAELLRSFGYEVYFPENHGALIGAKRLGSRYIPRASTHGFSTDICSYLTCDIGAFLSNETPLDVYGLSSVPKPDVLVYNTSQCRDVKEWFTFYAEKFNVPILGIDTPRDIDEISPALLSYLEASWNKLISDLEKVSGRNFDIKEFGRVLDLSGQACRLWQQFLESNTRRPALHSFFDHIILMAPVVVLRGKKEAVDFYTELTEEVSSLSSLTSLSPGDTDHIKEKYRFYWEGMPVWGKIRSISELLARHHIRVVTSTYCHSWVFDFDPSHALASCVKAYASIFIARSSDYKLDYLKELCRRFSIDAVLFHDSKTCPYNTNNRYGIPGKLKAQTGIPFLTFYGDLVDLRHFSEEEFTLRLEAFIEQLG